MRIIAAVVAALVWLALPGGAQTPDDRVIVPGERIGRWTLDMTVGEVEQMVRPPTLPPGRGSGIVDTRPGDDVQRGVMTVFWPHVFLGMGINDPQTGKALYLMTVSRDYRTTERVGSGDPANTVAIAYGMPTATTSVGPGLNRLIFNHIGVAFVTRGGEVIQVFVFRPGTGPGIWRM